MALIDSFEREHKERQSVHGAVACRYSVFADGEGNRFLQLDTYGSADRQLPGKVSQSLQLDEQGAAALLELIRDAFPQLNFSGQS